MLSSRSRVVLAYAALALVPLALYAGQLGGPFIFDDEEAISGNPSLRELGSPEVLQPPRETPVAARPVVNVSFAVTQALFGASPAAFHATNLALHVFCACLLFACLRRLLAAPSLPSAVSVHADEFAWVSAVLFAVHPLATEIVLYASQRTEALVALFYLAAIGLLVRAADSGRRPSFGLAALVGILGGASKEVFVTAPLAALFLDRAFYAGSFARAWQLRARYYLGLGCCVPVLVALQLDDPRPDSVRFGELGYLAAQGRVVLGYFATAVWPSGLAVDHGPLPRTLDLVGLLPLAAALAVLVATGAVLAFRTPKLGFLAVWIFGILAPSSSVFSIHTEVGADRRFYLPLAALLTYAVAGAGVWLLRTPNPHRRLVAVAAVALAVVGFAVSTRTHAATYASVRSVWEQVVRIHPDNPRGLYNLAETYRREGDLLRAAASFRAALALDDAYPDAHVNLGNLLMALGEPGQGLEHLRRGAALAPTDADARYNLGVALALTGHTDAALQELERAVRLQPTHLEALRKLARAYLALGRTGEAQAYAARLSELQPSDPIAAQVLRVAP